MHLIKYLFCNLSILICIVSCDIIIPNSEDTSIDWSESDYAFIDMENYPEWNTGVFTEDNTYLLVKEDTLSNGYIGYLNNSDIKSDGVALYFDENITLTSFMTNSGCCYISWKTSNKADIQIITESSNDFYKDITIDSSQIIPTRVAFVPIILAIARGASIAMTINSGVQGIKALLDGDLETAGKNALGLICGGVGGKVFKHALDDVAIDAAFAGFEKLEEKLTQTLQAKYLGNCNVSMNSKKTSINTYSLSITISNYETISATETNYILCGVAVRKWPYVTYSRSELKTEEFVVKGNGTTTINFELPENSGYYAVPYLLPVGGHINLPKDHIRHGNIIHLEYFDGFIDNFKQQSYSENGDKYTFNCNAHAICNTKNGQYWKLYYENNTGWKEFFEAKTYDYPSISSSNSAEFDFEIELSTDLFDDEKEDIKLGIAIFNSSHQMLIASDPQIFELNTITRKRLKKYNSHYVLYYDEKGRVIRHVDTRYNYGVEIKYNDTNNSASIYEDGEYSGSAQISNGLVRSICGESLSYDSKNNLIKSGNSSHTWSNGNITRSSKNYSFHTEYSNFTYGTQVNKLNIDIWASYNCYFPTYYVYFPHKNITANLPISRTSSFGKATYTYKFDEDGYVTQATEHFTTNDGKSGTETYTFEYETY